MKQTAAPKRDPGRVVLGGVVFLAAATLLFEAAGLPSSRVAAPVKGYEPVPVDDKDVQTALHFALTDQKRKNRSNGALKLLGVINAERQSSSGQNIRLCLSLDRRGRPDTARAVVHRNPKNEWAVALWAWGACGKAK